MISELQAERERLDEAIQALERLSATQAKRRGRPPRWMKNGQPLSSEETAMASAAGES